MPRRKKNDQSPARVPTGPPEGGSLAHNTDYRLPQYCDRPMANNFTPSGSEKENIVRNMQEMFAHLDPEVIYIVLSECDFKVDNAMDSLLELSVAAEDACPAPIPLSGFERTAAALLSPAHFSEPDSSKPSLQLVSSPSPVLSEELDLLLDQELEILTTQQDGTQEHHNSQRASGGSPPSSFLPPQFSQHVLPELLQSSLESGSEPPPHLTGSLEQVSGASSPLDQLSGFEHKVTERQESALEFKHLVTETSDRAKSVPPLDLGASGRPSAFQVYKKQNPSHTLSERAEVSTYDATVGGARSKVNVLNQEMLGHAPLSWNVGAPAFFPRIHGPQGPTFITPVASNWPSHPRHPPPWLSHGPVGHTPLRPPLTIPRSWALPAAPQLPGQCNKLRLDGRILVLLRGAPGSGKSTLARALLEHNPGGVILSTDNYFSRHGVYQFDPNELGEAHSWNHQQAKEAFQRGANPIIIDNTNMQGWEMKPYVSQALNYNYKVLFREPDTWWKNKPRELERRNTHNVCAEKIRRMLNAYERFVTVQSIMGSQMPEKKQCLILEDKSCQPEFSQTPCPDLVGDPGLSEESKKTRPQLFSSLPDVSSIGHSADMGILGDSSHKSTESLTFQAPARPLENPENTEGDDDINLGDLDSDLDVQLELNQFSGDQRIPDCIVESVMNEEHCRDDMPVAFSESIGQRVRRERTSRRSGFDRLEPADLVKDTHQSENAIKEKTEADEAERVEVMRDRGEVLDFAGDWPTEGSLEQRQVRRRERLNEEKDKEGGGERGEANENNTKKVQSKHDVTEFQKLLDLIQTGVADIQTGSSLPPSLSPSSEEELEADFEKGDGLEESQRSSQLNSADMSRVNSSRGELPDCVLDWKAADSCMVREPVNFRMDHWEHLKTKNETSITGENEDLIEMGQGTQPLDLKSANLANPPLTTSTDSDVILETTEAEEGSKEMESHSIRDAVGADVTGMENSSCAETPMEAESHTSEVCQSPEFEGFVDIAGSPLGVASANQETKQRQGRRSGKQCKLALTFTQNCPDFSVKSPECVTAPAPNVNPSLDSGHTDLQTNCDPDPNPKLNPLKPHCEAVLQPTVDTGRFTQTESQDFALLWRLNQQNNPDGKAAIAYSQSSDITVIHGNSSRFVPEVSGTVPATVAIQPSGHKEVPYRVVHEKSTQVKEKELGETENRLESLRILSRHFKLVSFDTLEDLFVKCHLDLEWTTNLLLDSGERFFRDDDGEEEKQERLDDQNLSSVCEVEEKMLCFNINELQIEDQPKVGLAMGLEGTQQVISSSSDSSKSTSILTVTGPASSVRDKDHTDTSALSGSKADTNTEHKATTHPDLQGGAWGVSTDAGVIIEEASVEMEDDVSSMDQIHRLLQAELEELEKEEKQRQQEQHKRRTTEQKRSQHMDIKSVELKLPTEVALQLTELFGPVGVDPGACSADDYDVQMDLKLAKLLHQKWKETIQEKQKQAALSFHLLQESSAEWGKSEVSKPWPRDRTQPGGTTALDSQLPFMDHWNVSRQHVSLRDIIKEEQLRQENMERVRQNRMELDKRDSSTPLKENQLYSHFPTIDRHFLLDIFRDHNYSLTQTELFLRSLLDEEPVKTVIAPEAPRTNHHRSASREREKRYKPVETAGADYQDPEDPEYQDFRAEADLQRRRQLESFAKAAEAYKQGLKEVASFYAQQGHLHGQRMREANHRAAVQIFERVNASLLPNNVLDLHGLHVVEALQHLGQVLEDKTADCEQGLCRPQLSVITGRGNHSQGGVARIRPAVIDYLTNKHYRFTEPKPGLILVSLK